MEGLFSSSLKTIHFDAETKSGKGNRSVSDGGSGRLSVTPGSSTLESLNSVSGLVSQRNDLLRDSQVGRPRSQGEVNLIGTDTKEKVG